MTFANSSTDMFLHTFIIFISALFSIFKLLKDCGVSPFFYNKKCQENVYK